MTKTTVFQGLLLLTVMLKLLAWPAVAAASPRWSEITDPVFFNYSTDQGLPFGRVSGVARDGEGFVWMVTADGLVRWDGYSFQSLPSGISDIDRDIRAVKADDEGRLWLGTGRGLYCFDPVDGAVHRFALSPTDSFAVIALELERRNAGLIVWLGTEKGVFQVDVATGAATQFMQAQISADRTMRVFDVLLGQDGSVWAGTSIGLFRKRNQEGQFKKFDLEPVLNSSTRIADLLETEPGEIWAGTPRNGVFKINNRDQVQAVEVPDFAGEWIYAMAEVDPGIVWLGTYGQGIIEINSAGGTYRRIQNNPLLKHSLSDDVVWTIATDPTGLVWVGTAMGLSLYDLSQQSVLTAFGGSGRGLRDRAVKSLLESKDGELLVGLRDSGVDIVDPYLGRVDSIGVDPSNAAQALPGGAIEAMVQLDNGDFVIGSNWGLYRYRKDSLQRLAFSGRDDLAFTGSLLVDGSDVWAGGTDGLWRLSIGEHSGIAAQVAASVGPEFTDPRISTMEPRASGGVVVGTWEGINWVDGTGSVLERIPAESENPSPMDNGYVTSILHDRDGRTWIGTSGAGIYIRGADGLARIGREEGLPSDLTGSLQKDAKGRVWVSTNSGLAVVDPATLKVTSLGPADGAMVAPYFRQPGLATTAGEILFGGESGLTIIKADSWVPNLRPEPVVITAVRIADEVVSDRSLGQTRSTPLVVAPDRNSVSIEFAALDFLAARTIRYRYRLEGYDSDWHVTDAERRTAAYTLLPPGDYELRLQASNRQGAWGDDVRELHLSVLPYWFQTRWAQWSAVAATAVLFFLLFRWRTAQLRRHRDSLESLIRERTLELEVSAEALKEKSAELETASMTDPLTGMHNRRFLDKHMPADQSMTLRRYSDARGEPIVLADLVFFVVDIDHFKRVNDVHGHAAGDAVLTAMRERLSHEFRESDYLVRWGGEEFLVVARAATRLHADSVAERIRLQVQDTPFDAGHGVLLSKTCSIGFCALPFDLSRPDALDWLDCVRLADLALYAAKRAGRNAWVGVSAGANVGDSDLMQQIAVDPGASLREGRIKLQSNLDRDLVESAWLTPD